jgi:hypothetical protein
MAAWGPDRVLFLGLGNRIIDQVWHRECGRVVPAILVVNHQGEPDVVHETANVTVAENTVRCHEE